jgi:MYXO-CTERM domain-containing protein
VASSLATFMAAGVDIAVVGAGASLVTVSPGTQLRNGEITHMGRIARSGANVQVQFALVAPPTNGTVTLQAVGNAANGDTRVSGDSWARATLPVTITGGAAAPDAAVTADAATRDGAAEYEAYDPSASMAYGGCAATPRGGDAGALLAGAAALGLAARRRRRPCAEG